MLRPIHAFIGFACAIVIALCSLGCVAFGSPSADIVDRVAQLAQRLTSEARDRDSGIVDVPEYSGEMSVQVNGNVPYFADADFARGTSTEFSQLDVYGRCGRAMALIGPETMPDEPRGSIGMIKPSGWHTIRYDWVDGGYLYNRCHLIAYQLTGENANPLNLITGTRSMNVLGMQPYEDEVASYVRTTKNHVLYRVTPIFESDNLVASGVLMEAQSIEDNGVGVRFCVWCYNVESGVVIDYATGESAPTDCGKTS